MEGPSITVAEIFPRWYASIEFTVHHLSNPVGISTGSDLSGNTFWEFKDKVHASRMRRIVKTSRNTHFADVQVTRTSYNPL